MLSERGESTAPRERENAISLPSPGHERKTGLITPLGVGRYMG